MEKNVRALGEENFGQISLDVTGKTFNEVLQHFFSFEYSFTSRWMMPKHGPQNLSICTLVTDGQNHLLAYLSRKNGKPFMVLINKEGIHRVNDLDGNLEC